MNYKKHSAVTDEELAQAFGEGLMNAANSYYDRHGCWPEIETIVTRPMHRRLMGCFLKHGGGADTASHICGFPIRVIDSPHMASVSRILP